MIHGPRKRLDLGEPGHHRRSIERNEAGQVVERELRRRVRVPEQHLRVGERQGRVEERQDPHGVHPADRRDDRPHRRVREGRVQVVGPGPRVGAELARGSPRTRHLANLEPEPAPQHVEPAVEHVREHARAAPRRRDDGHRVAGLEPRWTDRRRGRRGTLAHPGPDHDWSSRMLPSGSVRYVHVTRRPSDVPVVTTSPITPPPSASTASRAAATSGTANAMCPKPGRLIAVGRPLRLRSVLEDLERRAVRRRGPAGGDARRGAWRPERRSRPRGPGRRVVALGRHEDAAEDALVEVGEQPPVAGDEIDVAESGVDHDGPSSRRPRTQAPRTMSGCGPEDQPAHERPTDRRAARRSSGAAPRSGAVIAGVDRDQVGLLAGLDRADHVRRGRAPALRRASRAGASRAAPSAGRGLAGDRPQRLLRVRPDPHHAEDRRLRAARHVRPEPDGDPRLEPAGQRHHARRR